MIISERVADAATGTSVTAFGVSLAGWNEIVQIVAGLMAVVSGGFAVWYYWTRQHNAQIRMQWDADDRERNRDAD